MKNYISVKNKEILEEIHNTKKEKFATYGENSKKKTTTKD